MGILIITIILIVIILYLCFLLYWVKFDNIARQQTSLFRDLWPIRLWAVSLFFLRSSARVGSQEKKEADPFQILFKIFCTDFISITVVHCGNGVWKSLSEWKVTWLKWDVYLPAYRGRYWHCVIIPFDIIFTTLFIIESFFYLFINQYPQNYFYLWRSQSKIWYILVIMTIKRNIVFFSSEVLING